MNEEVYHRARIRAALMNTSVSALVRDALEEIAGSETEFERLRAEEEAIRMRLTSQAVAFSAGRRMTRERAHDRDAIR